MSSKTIKFNAGKVQYDEETNRCTPLPHKGIFTIKQSSEDEDFYDFTWTPKSSNSGNLEKDELLIIPGDVTFKKVKSCTTGRVFALTFLSSGAKHLYWLQDVGDDDEPSKLTNKDEEIVSQINSIILITDEDEEDKIEEESSAHDKIKEETQEQNLQSSNPSQNEPNFPISSIFDILEFDQLIKHLDKLTDKQITELYGKHLPESMSQNVKNLDILMMSKNGFFEQWVHNLDEQLNKGTGAGYLLAQSLKYNYKGEGVDGFLSGIRELAKKEKEQEKKNGDQQD